MENQFATGRDGGLRINWGLALLLPGLVAAAPAAAQDTAPSARQDVIVVTAQKREQSESDVGLSIVGLSRDTLRDKRITSIDDLTRVVPGLTYARTPAGPPVLTLRSVGFYDSTLSAAPAVSAYVDEAPLALPSFLQVGPIDLERVEVLKGPQGTLYGENSTGGAINYIAAKPTDTLHSGGTISFGRFAAFDGEAYVSGPLTDTLKARLAVRTEQGGDWQRSYTRADTNGATNAAAARAIVEWRPGGGTKFTLNVNGWTDHSEPQAVQLIQVACASPPTCPAALAHFPPAPQNARAADWTPGFLRPNHDHFLQTTLRADIPLGDAITLTTISGYQRFRQDKHLDDDGTALQALDFHQTGHARSFNQEVRLAGDEGRMHWIAGGYATTQRVEDDGVAFVSANSLGEPLPGIVPRSTTSAGDFGFRTRSAAAFGNAEYRLFDRLTVIGGVRFTATRQDFRGCERSGPDPAVGELLAYLSAAARGTLPEIDPVPADGCVAINADTLRQGLYRDRLSEQNVSWRSSLNYKTAGGSLIYITAAKGYKAGGFPSVNAATTAQYAPVTQEALLDYEAGLKAPLLGGVIRVEASAYYYDYRNKQVRGRLLDPVFGAIEALVNIPKSRVIGFEGAVRARPIAGLDIGASATYADSKVQRYVGISQEGTTVDYAGSPFPYSPRWSAMADATYDWAIGERRRAFVGSDLVHHSATNAALGNDPGLRLRAYTTLDLRGGIRAADDSWAISLFGQNVTNTYYWNNMFRFTDVTIRIAARPATYGLRLSIKR